MAGGGGWLSGCQAAYGNKQFSASVGTQNVSEASPILSVLVEIVETGGEGGTDAQSRFLGTLFPLLRESE